MDEEPEGICGYTWPEDCERKRRIDHYEHSRNCCYRTSLPDTNRCAWHADPEDTEGKTVQNLKKSRATYEIRKQNSPVSELLDGAVLSGVEASDEISLTQASLRDANFTDADFRRVDLTDADLSRAELTGVTFWGGDLAEVVLSDADLTTADLRGVNFTKAHIAGADLVNADLTDADLSETQIVYTNLTDADLTRVDLSGVEFRHTDLTGADLSNADLTGASIFATCLEKADLSEVDITNGDIVDSNITSGNLEKSILINTTLKDADLSKVNLSESVCSGIDTNQSSLMGADLRNTKFGESEIGIIANLEDANLKEADLRGATLERTRLYQTILTEARINAETTFVDGKETVYESEAELDGWFSKTTESAYQAGAWVHRRLEQLHDSNALSEKARRFHIRKQEAERAHHHSQALESDELVPSLKHIGRWGVLTISGALTRHGESLQRTVTVSVGVILFSALLYPFVGGFRSDQTNEAFRLTLSELIWSDLARSEILLTFARSLYFSVITFTTIGYGDLFPTGTGSRILVGLESLAGAVLIALFIFVLGRRTAR